MKIMRIRNSRINDHTYYKYRINLPKKIVERANLSEVNVHVILDGKRIIIEKDESIPSGSKLTSREKKMQKQLLELLQSKEKLQK
jgi:bifunctional DNA-binding transcriptional regulator/antitoxin component of YhaV-PrlF toxin-antitoxin module